MCHISCKYGISVYWYFSIGGAYYKYRTHCKNSPTIKSALLLSNVQGITPHSNSSILIMMWCMFYYISRPQGHHCSYTCMGKTYGTYYVLVHYCMTRMIIRTTVGKFGIEFNLVDFSETAKFNQRLYMKQWLTFIGFHQIKIRQMLRIGKPPN